MEWGEGPEPGSVHENCGCSADPVTDGERKEPEQNSTFNPTTEQLLDAALLLASLTPQGRAARLAAAAVSRLGRVGSRILSQARRLTKPSTTKPIERPKNIPRDWVQRPSKKQEGIRFVDPKNSGNEIRIQEGNPSSQFRNSRNRYVRWKKNGQWLDKYGKPSNDREKTHIPFEEFNFDLELFL